MTSERLLDNVQLVRFNLRTGMFPRICKPHEEFSYHWFRGKLLNVEYLIHKKQRTCLSFMRTNTDSIQLVDLLVHCIALFQKGFVKAHTNVKWKFGKISLGQNPQPLGPPRLDCALPSNPYQQPQTSATSTPPLWLPPCCSGFWAHSILFPFPGRHIGAGGQASEWRPGKPAHV